VALTEECIMSLIINVSPQFEQDLLREAIRDGIAPIVRAELLLRLAMALRSEGSETPFGSAVREFFRKHEIDPDQLATVLDQLNDACVPNARHPVKVFSPDVNAHISNRRVRPESLLRRWRTEAVHRPLEEEASRSAEVTSMRPSSMGKYAHLGLSSEDFMREKQEEIDREDRNLWSGSRP
jgi:hypothetical protein